MFVCQRPHIEINEISTTAPAHNFHDQMTSTFLRQSLATQPNPVQPFPFLGMDLPDVIFTIRPEPEPDTSEHVSNYNKMAPGHWSN